MTLLAGGGGDLCQLALELKSKNLTGDELVSEAYALFNSTSSTFSNADLTADLDAINIANIYTQLVDNKSISHAMNEYYKGINTNQRKLDVLKVAFPTFINTETGELTKSQATIISEIIIRLNSSMYIKLW